MLGERITTEGAVCIYCSEQFVPHDSHENNQPEFAFEFNKIFLRKCLFASRN